jgi:ubiquitin-like modifier-activating enzyme ATG7
MGVGRGGERAGPHGKHRGRARLPRARSQACPARCAGASLSFTSCASRNHSASTPLAPPCTCQLWAHGDAKVRCARVQRGAVILDRARARKARQLAPVGGGAGGVRCAAGRQAPGATRKSSYRITSARRRLPVASRARGGGVAVAARRCQLWQGAHTPWQVRLCSAASELSAHALWRPQDEPVVHDGRFRVPGSLVAVNTLETFVGTDRAALMRAAAEQLWADVRNGSAELSPSLLSRFVLLAFPDLKACTFRYWFCFPALRLAAAVTCAAVSPLLSALPAATAESVVTACNSWMHDQQGGVAWLVHVPEPDGGAAAAHSLSSWQALSALPGTVVLAFADPSNLANHPGWPLRNLLALACARWSCRALRVVCVRGGASKLNPRLSIVLDLLLPDAAAALPAGAGSAAPEAVGWEKDAQGQAGPRVVDLRACLDPAEQAEQAVSLNLRLMRWRLFPALDVERLSSTRCLLIGAGTLGCAVARTLLGWGVRQLTLLDCGTVAFSNPVRQSLFEFEDCLNGGRPKAVAAAERLRRIFPGAVTHGVDLRVPMPGHAVLPAEEASVARDVEQLEALVADSDMCFVLTDTRESRWLPTLLCAHLGKLAINAALGFDSFLVMRHGSGVGEECSDDRAADRPGGSAGLVGQRLGCYFCTDVVAPMDSTANRTLDQQCTVARPGLAPIAAALAVELAVSVLHHPDGAWATATSQSSALGMVPHQIRGSLSSVRRPLRCMHAAAFGSPPRPPLCFAV